MWVRLLRLDYGSLCKCTFSHGRVEELTDKTRFPSYTDPAKPIENRSISKTPVPDSSQYLLDTDAQGGAIQL